MIKVGVLLWIIPVHDVNILQDVNKESKLEHTLEAQFVETPAGESRVSI